MENEKEFKKELTIEEIDIEITKVGDFFKQIPERLRAQAAERFIYEIVNWGSRDHYQALGIFQEAMNTYRNVSLQILEEEAEEEHFSSVYGSACNFRCIQELEWKQGCTIAIGEVCKIGLWGKDSGYSGGEKYLVFQENGLYFDICQHRLEEHFEEIDGVSLEGD